MERSSASWAFVCPDLNTPQFKLENVGAGGPGKNSREQLSVGFHLWTEKKVLQLFTNSIFNQSLCYSQRSGFMNQFQTQTRPRAPVRAKERTEKPHNQSPSCALADNSHFVPLVAVVHATLN